MSQAVQQPVKVLMMPAPVHQRQQHVFIGFSTSAAFAVDMAETTTRYEQTVPQCARERDASPHCGVQRARTELVNINVNRCSFGRVHYLAL